MWSGKPFTKGLPHQLTLQFYKVNKQFDCIARRGPSVAKGNRNTYSAMDSEKGSTIGSNEGATNGTRGTNHTVAHGLGDQLSCHRPFIVMHKTIT